MLEQNYEQKLEFLNRNMSFLEPVRVIKRSDLDCLKEMDVEGVNTFLGEVRHFKSNPELKKLLPKNLSIAWTQMPAARELPAHFHPCSSLIIVADGEGESTGDTESKIETGDIVYIPEWNLHGFKGQGEKGFRALSIQFEEVGIFSSAEQTQTTYFDREQIPLSKRQLEIIPREKLKTINTIEVNGEVKDLGVLKNFSSDMTLKEKLPNYFSSAWVKLKTNQTLDDHVHDTDSMIIVMQGSGILSGDRSELITEGDIVHIPAGRIHGFTGAGDEGFWALSIQFQHQSLYEDESNPQVNFIEKKELTEFEKLLEKNEELVGEFQKNLIFSPAVASLMQDKSKVKKLKDCLQVMSSSFQRLMYSRMALASQSEYKKIFFEHLIDELGHDTELEKERASTETLWDPVLESSTSWFFAKNFLIDDPSRIVMIQMVLEKGASLFYSHFAKRLQSEHISSHSHLDEEHDKLGVDLLERESDEKLKNLHELLEQSWSMLNLYLNRVAEILLEKS